MTLVAAQQWMAEQRHLGCSVCLILDSLDELTARNGLLNNRAPELYCSIYRETPAADMADKGPFLFLIDNPEDEHLSELLKAPERNWGWLASVAPEAGLQALVKHWRDRMIFGVRPHRGIYRFHDNRVLARALKHLTTATVAGYLGPAISVCYWQGEHWETLVNPAPGNYPVPESPVWNDFPMEADQRASTREANAHRYLLARHLEAYARMAEQQDPELWLSTLLAQANTWGWQAAEQLEFLLVQRLKATTDPLAQRWQARPGESPDAHFQRVFQEVQFWQGDGLL